MKLLGRLLRRFGPPLASESEVDDELDFHLSMRESEFRQAGAPAAEARRRAMQRFGSYQKIRQECRAIDGVEHIEPRKGDTAMQGLLQDFRYAARMLLKNPGFTAVIVLTLALGIGVNTVIFSWLKAVALDSLPGVQRPRELVLMGGMSKKRSGCCSGVAYLTIRDFEKRSQTMSGILGYELIAVNLNAGRETERVRGTIVTGNYFDVLGVKAALGRTFFSDETQSVGTHPVAVISHGLWQRSFGSDPQAPGRQVSINGHPFTIIGVAPRGFGGVMVGLSFDIFVPATMQPAVAPGQNLVMNRGAGWLDVVGRLRSGVNIDQARAEMDVLAQQIEKEYPGTFTDMTLGVFKFLDAPLGIQGEMFPVLLMLMGVVALVLLIACGNVANLLLARATARTREISVRVALGASRSRVVRQLLTESFLLAALSGVAGLLVGVWCTRLLSGLISFGDLPVAFNVAPDRYVIGFAAGISLLTSIIFGLVPAVRLSKPDVAATLRDGGGAGRMRARLRSASLVAQVALSVVTLVCAGLFLRSLRNAQQTDPGFNAHGALMISLDVFPAGYEPDAGRQFYAQLLERVNALPGVKSATLARRPPLTQRGARGTFINEVEGYTPAPDERLGSIYDTVGAGYFATLEIPLVAGRDFTVEDRQGSTPVVIINETMAMKFWGAAPAVGKRIKAADRWHQVVGVARNAKYRSLGETGRIYMYAPHQQVYEPDMTLVVRTHGAPAAMIESVRGEIRALDKNLPPFDVKTIEQHVNGSLIAERMSAIGAGVFGLLALSLAAIGIYGVMAYSVSQRTREIGVRIALGARPAQVLQLILRQGLLLACLGVLIGSLAAFGTARLLVKMLFGVKLTDPVTYVAIAALLILVALAACWLPARRAANVDPMVALRHE